LLDSVEMLWLTQLAQEVPSALLLTDVRKLKNVANRALGSRLSRARTMRC
jgi:hypothetical protein